MLHRATVGVQLGQAADGAGPTGRSSGMVQYHEDGMSHGGTAGQAEKESLLSSRSSVKDAIALFQGQDKVLSGLGRYLWQSLTRKKAVDKKEGTINKLNIQQHVSQTRHTTLYKLQLLTLLWVSSQQSYMYRFLPLQ